MPGIKKIYIERFHAGWRNGRFELGIDKRGDLDDN